MDVRLCFSHRIRPNEWLCYSYPMITVHERRMLQVMNDITDKKDWFVQASKMEIQTTLY